MGRFNNIIHADVLFLIYQESRLTEQILLHLFFEIDFYVAQLFCLMSSTC
jgi:hypothetical protein